ncbi:MAG: ankyrin repeat domain-containing protein [Syntrophobacteraceae bacterium]
MLAALMVVFALWATVAVAGVKEDFFEAAKRGDLPAVKRFIANGTDVNAKDKNGNVALTTASFNGHKEIVRVLLAKGADVNAKMNNGKTALMAASAFGHKEIKKLLIKAGAKE